MPGSIANKKPLRPRRRVALIIETSLASGRSTLRGVARYIKEGTAWTIYHEPRGVERYLPGWLGDWQDDGVIVRVHNSRIAEAVLQTGLPAVDVLGVAGDCGLPLVHVDNRQIAIHAAVRSKRLMEDDPDAKHVAIEKEARFR